MTMAMQLQYTQLARCASMPTRPVHVRIRRNFYAQVQQDKLGVNRTHIDRPSDYNTQRKPVSCSFYPHALGKLFALSCAVESATLRKMRRLTPAGL